MERPITDMASMLTFRAFFRRFWDSWLRLVETGGLIKCLLAVASGFSRLG